MKHLFIFLFCIIIYQSSYAQRFLNPVFANANVYSNISYGSAVNVQSQLQTLVLDFYEPAGDALLNRPLLIYLHGGGFSDTNQTKSLPHIVAFCDSFARRGYTVASINYRLDSVNTGLSNRAIINAMHDAKAAIRFFKSFTSLFRVDTNLIFIGGESAGAITAMNATYINQAVEVLFPLTPPFSPNLSTEGNSGNPGYTSNVRAALCFCGGTNFVSGLPMFDTNAINLSTDPPVIFVHGTADPLIPVASALNVAIRASHIGIPNLFYTFNGATHCPWIIGLPNAQGYLDSLVNFTAPFLYAIVTTFSRLENGENSHFGFNIFPNPAQQFITINEHWRIVKEEHLSVYNAYGKQVLSDYINKEKKTIKISELPNGLYYIRFYDKPFSAKKFIKCDH
jgi:acetyl esterase/lipase